MIDLLPSMFLNQEEGGFLNIDKMYLDDENCILVIPGALNKVQLDTFVYNACNIKRINLKFKHRAIYHSESLNPVYSDVSHPDTRFPTHITDASDIFLSKFTQVMKTEPEEYILSHGVDSLYLPRPKNIKKGKFVREESFPDPWYTSIIHNIGQTRVLKIKNISTGGRFSLYLLHNSLIILNGPSAQEKYSIHIRKMSSHPSWHKRPSLVYEAFYKLKSKP